MSIITTDPNASKWLYTTDPNTGEKIVQNLANISYIYLLRHPHTRVPVYVGKSRNPFHRFVLHLMGHNDHNEALQAWLDGLRDCHAEPLMDVVEIIQVGTEREHEDAWMEKLRAQGLDLFNIETPWTRRPNPITCD